MSHALMLVGDRIASCYTRKKYEVAELGIMYPEEVATSELRPGQVGFVACNMKESSEGNVPVTSMTRPYRCLLIE